MTYASEQDADSPVVRWKFDETGGTTYADDLSGTRTLTSTSTVNDNQSPASLSGLGVGVQLAGGYLSASNMSGLLSTNTIEAVLSFTSIPGSGTYMVFTHAWADGSTIPLVLGFDVSGGAGQLQFGFFDGESQNWRLISWPSAQSGTMYHIVGVYDGSTSLKLYVNGQLVESGTVSARPGSDTVENTAYVGHKWDFSSANTLSATIYDLALYSSSLSGERINAHYRAAGGVTGSANTSAYDTAVMADTPVVYLKLDEASGTTAYDASWNGNNATIPSSGVSYRSSGIAGGLPYSLYLNTNTQSINIPYTGFINSSSFSLECWLYPNNWANNTPLGIWDLKTERILVRKGDSGSGYNYQVGLSTAQASAQNLYNPGGNNNVQQHIVLTYNSSSGLLTFYLNGESVGTHTFVTGGFSWGTSGTLAFSSNNGANTRLTHGYASNLAVYASELSSARVAAHYAAGTQAYRLKDSAYLTRRLTFATQQRSRRY